MADRAPKVLITGANGFVGARLCHRFLLEGFRVIAGVRQTSDLSTLDTLQVEYRFGDVTRPDSLPDLVADVDYVIHNAGVTKARNDDTFFLVNEDGTRCLFEAIAEHNSEVTRVVYVSSLAAAGPSRAGRPVTEEDAPQPVTTYGASKLAGEKAAVRFSERLPAVVVRPSGVYGPGDKEIFGFFQTVHYHIRPSIGNADRMIQLVHVDDLCRAVYLAATADVPSGRTYFVAEKQAYTMRELVGLLVKAIGRTTIPLVLPSPLFRGVAAISEAAFRVVGVTPMLTREKAGELLASWEVSTERARRELGFESQIPFERGARETYDWYLRKGWLK